MADVNPPPLRVPKALSFDREVFNYFTQLHRFLLQLWTQVEGGTGGGEVISGDSIFELPRTADLEPLARLVHSMDTLAQTAALEQRLEELERRIESLDTPRRDPLIDELEVLTYGSQL